MISAEPTIRVGILEHRLEIQGRLNGAFELPNKQLISGNFFVTPENGSVIICDEKKKGVARGSDILCRSLHDATFTLHAVTIGISFHWEQQETQTFEGDLRFVVENDGAITAINEIGIESYLKSVISSEMNAQAPVELLKAHAVISRSWLVAMLEHKKSSTSNHTPISRGIKTETEIVRWYDREDHTLFDVCADDHCQRYQGMTKIISPEIEKIIQTTRGTFLIHNDRICDARFSKACGGITEPFETTWENTALPFLQSVSDSAISHPRIKTEADAEHWILDKPDAYCNTHDRNVLKQILPSFDQSTTDFFRWKVEYTREELEALLLKKSGIDFGTLLDITPMQRGPSGRISKLKITGTKRTIIVGKELEIRKWLSPSHLYSSAFIVKVARTPKNIPVRFIFHGAGWGHGVGLCQIGAAVMASKGFMAEEILQHYFSGATFKMIY
jgi:stage II sporulation protein D